MSGFGLQSPGLAQCEAAFRDNEIDGEVTGCNPSAERAIVAGKV